MESRKKMSEHRKGIAPWNKGIACPLEVKKKISNTLKGHVLTYEHRKKLSQSCKGVNRGEKNGMWKGGIRRSGKYVYITLPNGTCIAEHRYLMEKLHGRKLLSNEVVHHINGRRDDNRLENLILMDESAHHTMHDLEIHKRLGHKLT